jgi:Protein of unknown function (DUF1579)
MRDVCLGILTLGLVLTTGIAAAQDPNAKPGPVHEKLMKLAGEYTTVTYFTTKPGDAPQETKGAAKLTSTLGGRFLNEEASGVMFGQPYSSMHMTGYNNVTGQYESLWAYTGTTGMMLMTGTSKDDGKTIQLVGNYEREKGVKAHLYAVLRLVDDDHFAVELYSEKPDENKGPVMKTSYTRTKK